jgi:hypothetical protein
MWGTRKTRGSNRKASGLEDLSYSSVRIFWRLVTKEESGREEA